MQEIAKRPDAPAPYEGYDVLAKWNTPSFDDRTREVLAARLRDIPPRRFFSRDELSLLEAITERLAPPLPALSPGLLALWIDDRLYRNLGEGFRSDGAPPLQESWRLGLAAIDGEARRRFSSPFVALAPVDKDRTLQSVQDGDTNPELWRNLHPRHSSLTRC